VAGGDPLTDLPLAIAGIGELVCVLERAGELLAGDGVLAQGGVAAFLEAVAELGQRGGAMLELPHERQAGVGELGALERRRRRREPVERELDDRAAVGDRGDLGVDREVAELADRDALPVGKRLHAHGEELRGVGSGGDRSPVDGHAEEVAAGVDALLGRRAHGVDLLGEGGGAVLRAGDGAFEGVLGALPGALEAVKAGDFGVDLGFVEDQRVAGGERFDLGEAQGVLADVLDLADVEAAAHDLVDEPGFALDGLPAVGVEAPLGGVANDVDLGVLVALAHAAAVALLDVGRAPGAVEVVDRDAAVLNVGAHPIFSVEPTSTGTLMEAIVGSDNRRRIKAGMMAGGFALLSHACAGRADVVCQTARRRHAASRMRAVECRFAIWSAPPRWLRAPDEPRALARSHGQPASTTCTDLATSRCMATCRPRPAFCLRELGMAARRRDCLCPIRAARLGPVRLLPSCLQRPSAWLALRVEIGRECSRACCSVPRTGCSQRFQDACAATDVGAGWSACREFASCRSALMKSMRAGYA
jgi:hypothetical protein